MSFDVIELVVLTMVVILSCIYVLLFSNSQSFWRSSIEYVTILIFQLPNRIVWSTFVLRKIIHPMCRLESVWSFRNLDCTTISLCNNEYSIIRIVRKDRSEIKYFKRNTKIIFENICALLSTISLWNQLYGWMQIIWRFLCPLPVRWQQWWSKLALRDFFTL